MLLSPTFSNDGADLVSLQIQIKLLPAAVLTRCLPPLSFRHSGARLCDSARPIFFKFPVKTSLQVWNISTVWGNFGQAEIILQRYLVSAKHCSMNQGEYMVKTLLNIIFGLKMEKKIILDLYSIVFTFTIWHCFGKRKPNWLFPDHQVFHEHLKSLQWEQAICRESQKIGFPRISFSPPMSVIVE